MKIAYALVSIAILLLGVLHMATTFRLSSSPTSKVWFFGAGIALALAGILNLLNRRYGLDAFGVRAVCIGTNLVMVCFAIIAGRMTGASAAEQLVMLAVLISALVLSTLRSATFRPQTPSAK